LDARYCAQSPGLIQRVRSGFSSAAIPSPRFSPPFGWPRGWPFGDSPGPGPGSSRARIGRGTLVDQSAIGAGAHRDPPLSAPVAIRPGSRYGTLGIWVTVAQTVPAPVGGSQLAVPRGCLPFSAQILAGRVFRCLRLSHGPRKCSSRFVWAFRVRGFRCPGLPWIVGVRGVWRLRLARTVHLRGRTVRGGSVSVEESRVAGSSQMTAPRVVQRACCASRPASSRSTQKDSSVS